MSLNVSLTPQLEAMVKQKVESGMYNSASEVIREGLRLLDEQDKLREIRFEELRREIQKGLDELDQGKGAPLDMAAIKAEARRRYEEERR